MRAVHVRMWLGLPLFALLLAAPRAVLAQALSGGLEGLEASHEGNPANIAGHEFVYDYKTDTIIVRGNAHLTQGPTFLSADELDYARNQREARAYGHVHLIDPEVELKASEAELEVDNETGRLLDADVRVRDSTYHLSGKEIRKLGGQRYSVRDGFFTTCGCEGGTPAWSVAADEMDVHLGEKGSASGARFNILGVPVLKLPYATFPADSERSSGLLSPRMGESRLRGFQYFQPFYLAINKSSDATVALDLETSARIGFLSEYRLQNGEDDFFRFSGGFFDEGIRANRNNDIVDEQIADPHVPLDRYDLIGLTREHLTPDLTVYGDTITVSDSILLRELNVYTLSRGYGSNFNVLRDAISHVGLLQSFDDSFIRMQGEWNEDLIQDQQFALQTLPGIVWSGRQDLGGIAYADYDVQGDDFWRQSGVRGLRLDLNPRVTMPWRFGDFLTTFATLGARETVYDASGHDITVIPVGTNGLSNNNGLAVGPLNEGGLRTRELLYGTVGASSEIERIYDLNWDSIEKVKHTIEPLVTYSYVPGVSQGALPLFDEVDRVEPRSLITYGAVSRLFVRTAAQPPQSPGKPDNSAIQAPGTDEDDDTEPEGQSYMNGASVREAMRLTVLEAYDTDNAVSSDGSKLSDLDLNANLFPTSVASFGSETGLSPSERQISYANVYMTFRPPWAVGSAPSIYMGRAVTGPFLQVMYNFVGNNGASHTFAARAYYELFDRLGVYYSPIYDIAGGKLLSSEYGARIKSTCNCWAFDFGVTDTINPNEVQFEFQLTLGGLGSVGHNPFGRNPFSNYEGGSGVLPSLY